MNKYALVRLGSVLAGGVVIIGLTGAGCSNSGSSAKSPTYATVPATVASAAPAATTPPTPAPTPTTRFTLAQQNAINSAQQYLALGEGFSRAGLIGQLSSSAGDGYSVTDATFAVDSLNVDWNAEAVLAAKSYLKTTSFSCTNLVEQLDSAAGSQFTPAQAQYGAHAVGIC